MTKQELAPKRETTGRQEALRRIAALIEDKMTQQGLSEDEKDRRVENFARRADEAVHAKF